MLNNRRARAVLVVTLGLVVPRVAAGQTAPIIIGPTSVLAWDDLGVAPATAGTFTVHATIDSGAPVALTGVVCGAGPTASDSTCTAPIAQIPTGSHTITLTNTAGAVVSLPSAPFTFVDLLIPVPTTPRVKP